MIHSTYTRLGVPIPTSTNVIPPITDPMGHHWSQPDLSDVLMDDITVILTQQQFDMLAEYSTTDPSGAYHGKCWKARSYQVDDQTFRPTGPWMLR